MAELTQIELVFHYWCQFGSPVVCNKCSELDEKIAHYRSLRMRITDQLTLSGLSLLIEQYEAEKRELHPEPKK